MSDFRFGLDDYGLNYYPHDVKDEMGGIDWDRVDFVKIDWVVFVRERTCKNKAPRYLDFLCSVCGFVHYIDDVNCTGDGNEWKYCPGCGCEVEREVP